jgi:hypothetical protein
MVPIASPSRRVGIATLVVVLFVVVAQPSGGSPAGLLPDAHGTRVLWYEDGDLAGCSSSVTSPLDSECPRFSGLQLDRTWANASAEESGAT